MEAPMQKHTEVTIDRAAVAARAYELFRARGGEPGHDVEDWLRAEAELRRATSVQNAVAEISLLPPPAGMEPIRLKRRRTTTRKA
jgi:hypothetical protein